MTVHDTVFVKLPYTRAYEGLYKNCPRNRHLSRRGVPDEGPSRARDAIARNQRGVNTRLSREAVRTALEFDLRAVGIEGGTGA
jgi:hypothetical protein